MTEQTAQASPSSAPDTDSAAGRTGWGWFALRCLLRAGSLAFMVAFAREFRYDRPQTLIDSFWVASMLLWAIDIWVRDRRPPATARLSRADLVPIALLLAVYVPAWLPFYDNWRWAYTGDSVAWYLIALQAATSGIGQNLLSYRGVDENFTYLFCISHGALMFLFTPNLFWHRATQLLVSCMGLAAIYSYFTYHLSRWWAVTIATIIAANYVYLWFTYISYGHIVSHFFSFVLLLLGTMTWRQPDRLRLWMLCGLVSGIAMFFAQTGWVEIGAVCGILGIYAIVTRRFEALFVLVVSYLLPIIPLILQWQGMLAMTTRQAKSIFAPNYLFNIFTSIWLLPYASEHRTLGIQGAFFQPPFGHSYLAGLGLGALSLVPAIRQKLRIPWLTTGLALLLILSVVLMTLTNNGYMDASTKRTYHLIPLQAFFAVLPAYVLAQWLPRRAWARAAMAIVIVASIAAYATKNYLLVRYPAQRVYGVNVFDGMIELRQRYPERGTTFFTQRKEIAAMLLDRNGLYGGDYRLVDTLEVKMELTEPEWRKACNAGRIICYEQNFDEAIIRELVKPFRDKLRPFPLLNATELTCFECPEPLPE